MSKHATNGEHAAPPTRQPRHPAAAKPADRHTGGGWFRVPNAIVSTGKNPNPWFRDVNGHTVKVMLWLLRQWRDEHDRVKVTINRLAANCGRDRGTNSRALSALVTAGVLRLEHRGTPGTPSTYRLLLDGCASATIPDADGCASGAQRLRQRRTKVAPAQPNGCASSALLKTSPKTPNKTSTNTSLPAAGGDGLPCEGKDEEERIQADQALLAAGVHEPTRSRLIDEIPGLTATVVKLLDAETEAGGGGAGLLVRRIQSDAPQVMAELAAGQTPVRPARRPPRLSAYDRQMQVIDAVFDDQPDAAPAAVVVDDLSSVLRTLPTPADPSAERARALRTLSRPPPPRLPPRKDNHEPA